eukprot:TRINITY_DN61685_c0_g1_i1.p1 TRINITY_DN61685_c0_g1~~TRINITY_DN61685_c0_g1_i1.p1  ORF type:complete len:414 (-),score=65.30 TRINITY_DN61685_c0_g1_i1:44-1285(-)
MSVSGGSLPTSTRYSGSANPLSTRTGSPSRSSGASLAAASPRGTIANGARGQWQWLANRGTWQDFDANACRLLEKARTNGRGKCTVSLACGRIEVDLQRMVQRMYCNTSLEHRVRRFDPSEPEDAGDSGGGDGQETVARGAVAAAPLAVATASAAAPPLPALPRAATPKSVPVARSGSRRRVRTACGSPSPAPKATTAASRRALQSAGSALVSQPGTSPGARTGGARGFGASAAVMTDDDEALSLALALSLAGEDTSSRGHSGQSRNSVDMDETLALLLAHGQQNFDDDALAAAIAASTGGANSAGRRGDAVDVDNMTYEELMALGERIGNVDRPSKIQAWQLDVLPRRTVPPSGIGGEDTDCAVCCDDYHPGDEIRTLPCLHMFHAACIDDWLLSDMPGARSCPVCHTHVEL